MASGLKIIDLIVGNGAKAVAGTKQEELFHYFNPVYHSIWYRLVFVEFLLLKIQYLL
tara:strand:+ start:360 stop:530 length:171 start_codon:yes stop_codon:yes gene_type:complete